MRTISSKKGSVFTLWSVCCSVLKRFTQLGVLNEFFFEIKGMENKYVAIFPSSFKFIMRKKTSAYVVKCVFYYFTSFAWAHKLKFNFTASGKLLCAIFLWNIWRENVYKMRNSTEFSLSTTRMQPTLGH